MARINRLFEQKVIQIDKLLQTNLFVAKQWIDTSIIRRIGWDFRSNTRYWDEMKKMMVREGILTKTKVEGISDDIWSVGKRCCVASSDDELIRWFQLVIPAFYNARPVDIVKMSNGEDALRALIFTNDYRNNVGSAVTHQMGEYALKSGYNGLVIPSARNIGENNIVIFNPNVIK